MVMTHTTGHDVQRAIERLRSEFATAVHTFNGCSMVATASFGIAGFERGQAQPTFSQLVSLADAALYSAKRAGRNRLEIAAPALH
jgi:diguanylate cyclase (GGDEF)-like protein